MHQETDQIIRHIETEREKLGRNLDDIESRFKNATDLRRHFDQHTGLILGAAVAGGFLLGLTGSRSSSAEAPSRRYSENPVPRLAGQPSPLAKHWDKVTETIDDIVEGLVAVAADKLRSYVGDSVPGFHDHYQNVVSDRGRGSVQPMKSSTATEGAFRRSNE